MQQESTQPVRTFSIGFHEQEYDEAPYARAVAQHLGTEHVERYLTPAESLEVIPRLPTMFDHSVVHGSEDFVGVPLGGRWSACMQRGRRL